MFGPVLRRSLANNIHKKASSGDLGPEAAYQATRVVRKYPLGASLFEVRSHLKEINDCKNPVADKKAPIPEDPRVLSRHIKSLGYFLGADLIGNLRNPGRRGIFGR